MKTATLGKEHSNKSILCSYTFQVLLLDGFCKFILHRFLIFGLYSFYTILFLFHSSCSFKSHTPANTEAHFHKPWLTWNRMLPAYQKPNGYLEAYIIVYIFISLQQPLCLTSSSCVLASPLVSFTDEKQKRAENPENTAQATTDI